MELYDNTESGHGNRPLYGTKLNPQQFGEITARYSLRLPANGLYEPHQHFHYIKAYDKDANEIGGFQWKKDTGEILGMYVDEPHRRKKVATAMWSMAHQLSGEYGVARPKHSNDRSDMGEEWAKSTGTPMPRRWDESDFPDVN